MREKSRLFCPLRLLLGYPISEEEKILAISVSFLMHGQIDK
jgi:hypothetical protein